MEFKTTEIRSSTPVLKEYSVILIKSFYDINQQILRKNSYFQISVDSDFPFASYAWLCTLALLNRLLC